MRSIVKGFALATAAAAIFVTTYSYAEQTTSAPAKGKPTKCYGINKCRGHAQCGTKSANACAGQNACKGKGWIFTKTDKECLAKGGKPL